MEKRKKTWRISKFVFDIVFSFSSNWSIDSNNKSSATLNINFKKKEKKINERKRRN